MSHGLIQSYSSLRYPPESETSLWSHKRPLVGSTLATFDQKQPFTITVVTADKIIVTRQATEKERPITRDDMEGAWLALLWRSELSLMGVKHEMSDLEPGVCNDQDAGGDL